MLEQQPEQSEDQGQRNIGARWWSLIIGGAMLLLVCFTWLSRPNSSAQSFYELVVNEMTSDSTIAGVRELLGESKVLEIDEVPSWAKSWDERNRQFFPDGVQSDDTFLHYVVSNEQGNDDWYFQFRDGKLVNFDPAWYAESRSLVVGLAN